MTAASVLFTLIRAKQNEQILVMQCRGGGWGGGDEEDLSRREVIHFLPTELPAVLSAIHWGNMIMQGTCTRSEYQGHL